MTVRPGAPEEPFLRLHPLTPVAAFLRVGAPLAAFLVLSAGEHQAGDRSGLTTTIIIFGAAAVAMAIGATVTYLVTTYRLEAGELRVDSGLLTRQSKRVRLDRLQNVDVRQPWSARILGLAELRVSTAGTSRESVHLRYLAAPAARALRAELIGRAAGLGPGVVEAPEKPLLVVDPSRLVGSSVLSLLSWRIAPVVIVAVTIFATALHAGSNHLAAALAGAVFVIVLTLGRILWARVGNFWNFTISQSPDGLRLRRGLVNTQTNTIPPGRIQALRIHQPLMWRPFGWATLLVNIAGIGDRRTRFEHIMIPVARYDEAAWLMSVCLGGVEPQRVPLTRPPRRSWLVAPLWWRGMRAGSDDQVFVTRHGIFSRSMEVVPHERTQSVHLHAGPLARWLRLASLHLDSTRGPVRIRAAHRDFQEARTMLDAQADRARRARETAVPARWMQAPHASGTVAPRES